MRYSSRPGPLLRAAVLLGGFSALLATQPTPAAPLEEYTGMTNAANVHLGKRKSHDPKVLAVAFRDLRQAQIKFAADDPKRPVPKEIAGTIYSMVLDRHNGTVDDPWGTGVKDFVNLFQAGRDSWKQKLDTNAKYLYLYQVFNDYDGPEGWVYRASVRLLVDPRLITSWGYLAGMRRGVGLEGIGFALPDKDKDAPAGAIRPISAETTYDGVRVYKPLPPYLLAREHTKNTNHRVRVYDFTKIRLTRGPVRPRPGLTTRKPTSPKTFRWCSTPISAGTTRCFVRATSPRGRPTTIAVLPRQAGGGRGTGRSTPASRGPRSPRCISGSSTMTASIVFAIGTGTRIVRLPPLASCGR